MEARARRDFSICTKSRKIHIPGSPLTESFFGVLKSERVNRRCYLTRSEARADMFEYIECFYNPIKRRVVAASQQAQIALTQPSVETG